MHQGRRSARAEAGEFFTLHKLENRSKLSHGAPCEACWRAVQHRRGPDNGQVRGIETRKFPQPDPQKQYYLRCSFNRPRLVSASAKGKTTQKAALPIGIGNAAPDESSASLATPFGVGGSDVFRWFRSLSLFQIGLLFAAGFLFTSPYGTNKLLTVSDLFVGDAILLPAVVFYLLFIKSAAAVRKELFSGLKALSFVGLFLLFILGAMTTDWNVIASFTDLRCACIIFGFFFLCSSTDEKVRVNAIYSAIIMVIVSLVSSAIYYRFYPDDDGGVKNYYPSYGCFLLAVAAIYEKKPYLGILGFALSLFIAATSFYRSLMFVPVIFLLILARNFFRDITARDAQSRRNAYIIGAFFLIAVLSSGLLANAIIENFNSSEGAVEQGVTKLNNLFDMLQGKGLGEGDDLRAEYLSYIGSHVFSFIVPSGFGHKALIGHWGPAWTDETLNQLGASSLDGMHLFLLCHFGLLLAILIVAHVFVRLSNSLLQTHASTFALRLIILCFIFGDSFVTASPFALISNAVFCGATLGCLAFLQGPTKTALRPAHQSVQP